MYLHIFINIYISTQVAQPICEYRVVYINEIAFTERVRGGERERVQKRERVREREREGEKVRGGLESVWV